MTAPTRADVDRRLDETPRSSSRRIPAVIAIAMLWAGLVGFGVGYFGHRPKAHAPVVSTPATAAPFAEECRDGMRVFTTPQGGIAVFPVGGAGCRP